MSQVSETTSKEKRNPNTRRVVGTLNPQAFRTVKKVLKQRGQSVQSAVLMGLIQVLELDLTLDQLGPDYKDDEEEEEE